MKQYFWRFAPLAIATGASFLLACYVVSRPVVESHHLSLLLASLVWVTIASWVALSSGHIQLAKNLRDLTPGLILLHVFLALFFAVLVYLSRRAVPLAIVPLVFALWYACAASAVPRLRLVRMLGATVLIAVLLESSLLALGSVPIPATLALRRALYLNRGGWIETDPACSRHDPELGYTLRPGECRFANLEFDTAIRVNSLGVRDDEASLERPEIVVLGDSYAMGWGVPEEAMFGSRLETMTGLSVLNAGVSSYGTARELALFRRIDGQNIRYLVIQYHSGDIYENLAFVENRYRLPVLDSAWFADLLRDGAASRRYYPGKATTVVLEDLLLRPLAAELTRTINGSAEIRGTDRRHEAAIFLQVLGTASVAAPGVRVIVLEFDDRTGSVQDEHGTGSPFVEELRRLLDNDPRLSNVLVLDVMPFMDAEDYFEIDSHANATGHEKVARLLHAEICRLTAKDEAAGERTIAGCVS